MEVEVVVVVVFMCRVDIAGAGGCDLSEYGRSR